MFDWSEKLSLKMRAPSVFFVQSKDAFNLRRVFCWLNISIQIFHLASFLVFALVLLLFVEFIESILALLFRLVIWVFCFILVFLSKMIVPLRVYVQLIILHSDLSRSEDLP